MMEISIQKNYNLVEDEHMSETKIEKLVNEATEKAALTINTNIVWAFGLCLHYFIQNPELRGFWISFFPFLLWGIHWCLIADVFYPLKKMLPFISACISAMGWFVRLMGLFILYDII
mgnify:CR=1 FL=1